MKKLIINILLLQGIITSNLLAQVSYPFNTFNTGGDYIGWDATFGSPPLLIKTTNADAINFATGNVQRATITSTGDFGIGTTPTNKLTVAGNADVTGNLGVGVVTAVERIDLNGNIHMPQSGTINLNPTNEVFIANPVKSNILIGIGAGISITSGTSCTYLGEFAGATSTGTGGNTYIGWQSGASATGAENTFLGSRSGESNTSNNNVFIGMSAGQFSSTGANCVVVGSMAGINNEADNSTFIGSSAGSQNTTGRQNTFTGFSSGFNCVSGNFNTFNGFNSGLNNTASGNTLIGNEAGLTNSSGANLVFLGFQAGFANNGGDNNTFIGYESGRSNTGAGGNTFTGYRSGRANSAVNNTFIGMESGAANMSATGQTFVGYHSGVANTSGANNTFLGFESGLANTTAAGNAFVGYRSGRANTAANNTFIGTEAGAGNVGAVGLTFLGYHAGFGSNTGNQNTFLGFETGLINQAGDDNTFCGYNSGKGNGAGKRNTFVGSLAGLANAGADNSTFVGFQAGTVSTGKANTFVGSNSGLRNTSGEQNVFLGQASGVQITTGSANTYLGWNTGPSTSAIPSPSLTNSAAIGANAEVLNNNHMILGDNAVSVGIGLSGDPTGPTAKLDVRQPAVIVAPAVTGINAIVNGANTENRAGTFIANNATTNRGILATCSGVATSNVAGQFLAAAATNNIGIDVNGNFGTVGIGGRFISTGSTNTNTGVSSLANSPFASINYGGVFTAAGGAANNYGLRVVASGASTINYGIYASNIITGTSCSAPGCADAAGYFSGPICVTDLSYVPSDLNLKTNVNDLSNANTILSQLQPKTYYYDTVQYNMNLAKGLQFGLIAQELELVLPQFTRQFVEPETKDSLGNIINPQVNFTGISYEPLITLLIAGYKEQQLQIDSLINAIAAGNQPKMANPNTIEVTLRNQSKIILNQNDPNPFAENTTINYFIPDNVNAAQLLFYDNSGTILKTVDIKEKGQGSILIYGSNLSSGVYTYTLLADGKPIETKRMVKIK